MSFSRQYLALAMSSAFGAAAGVWLAEAAGSWPLALFACVLVIAFGYGYAWPLWGYAATALLALAISLNAQVDRIALLERSELTRGPWVCELKVGDRVETLESKAGRRWVGFHSQLGAVALKVVMPVESAADLPRAGELWRISGWLEKSGTKDFRRRRLWVGTRGTAAVRIKAAPRWRRALLDFRADCSRRLAIGLRQGRPSIDVMRALLLGERQQLPREYKRIFSDSGTMHLFAISGLHIGAIGGALMLLAMLLAFPYRWAGVVVSPLVWAYVLMIGAPPSAVRAAAMFSLAVAARCCWRKCDLVVVWSQVFIVMHLMEPWLIVDTGSLLSFTVMLFILVWIEVVGRGVTIAAWAAGVPIVARVFGVVTPIGLAANLVMLPAAVVMVYSGLAGIAVSFISTKIAAHINNFSALLIDLMVTLADIFSRVPLGNLEIGTFSLWSCVLWYVAFALVIWLCQYRARLRRGIWA